MDGNGRWAKKKGKLRILGHKKGFIAVKKSVNFALVNKFKMLTLYAFSSENWNRPALEINALMKLFLFALRSEVNNLNKYNIRLHIIGDISPFSKDFKDAIEKIERLTVKNTGLILNIAANYSGRWDIIQGLKKIINEVQEGILNKEDITEYTLDKNLSTSNRFPVDLVIRTGGEKRISNFLLWQIAYSEFYFTDILWPDFNHFSFQEAVNAFFSRERRFGGL